MGANTHPPAEGTQRAEEPGKELSPRKEPGDKFSCQKNSFKLNKSVLSLFTRSVGTRLYASPEQLKEASYGQPSDIYSLGIVLMRILTPTYTQMETVMLIEKLRKGELRESFNDYFPLLHELILQMLSSQPSERPSLDKIEQVIVEEEIRIFRELHQNCDAQVRGLFDSAENTLNICHFSNILWAQISNELEPVHKDCLLIIRNDEILVFYDREKKSRLTLYISEYSIIVHKKRKIVCLSNHLKVDQRLAFKWEGDMYCLVKYAEDQRCSVF